MTGAGDEWRAVAAAFPGDAYFSAQVDFYARPVEYLRAFLDRAAPAIAAYRQRGRVATLAVKAERAVRELEPFTKIRFARYAGAFAAPDPAPGDIRAAEAACNALAEELRRFQANANAAAKAGRRSAEARTEGRQAFLARWRQLRRSCDSDAEADRVMAWELGCTQGAMKARRRRADERPGR